MGSRRNTLTLENDEGFHAMGKGRKELPILFFAASRLCVHALK